jgi:uncharacterized protein HemX
MSDTDNDQKLEPTAADDAPVDEPVEIESPTDGPAEKESATDGPTEKESAPVEDSAAEEKPAKRRGGAVGWLALLLSLIALAAGGYAVSRDWLATNDSSAEDEKARLNSRVAAVQEGLSAVDARVAELDAPINSAAAEIDALRDELDARVSGVASLAPRMSSLESTVAALSGVSEASRDTWLLAEAEYYLQIANAQLQLANNPQLAALALGMADERVVQISDPGLTDVRRAISDDMAALSVMEKPDIAGATLTLASLARVVESLPLTGAASRTDNGEQPGDTDLSGMQRAWSSMKNAMSGLVKVTPPDQAQLALISPDAEYFLRNNLALQLQSARLALLRGEQTVFEQTLDDASALISQYFDGESAAVGGALDTLAEIRATVLATSVPDISGSLRLLRQYRTLSENAQ